VGQQRVRFTKPKRARIDFREQRYFRRNADWFTGKHAAGYVTMGAAYKLTGKLTGVAAYSIGNANAS
jgi:hypothetical protein